MSGVAHLTLNINIFVADYHSFLCRLSLLADPRYPSISRDVLFVIPTEGYLEANTSFTAKTKTLLKITFTAK